MSIQSYKSTPGLDRYSANERYGAYRAAHRRLLLQDLNYRRHYRWYRIAELVVALVGASIWIGSHALSAVGWLTVLMAPAAALGVLVLQQKRYMNLRIGKILQAQAR
jgi:hypothetical protein